MAQLPLAHGITLEYETMGDPSHPAIVLIMGLGGQLTLWPDDFCQMLVEHNYYVIRFDNRDIGLSTKMENQRVPHPIQLLAKVRLGFDAQVPYTLHDMAKDTVGLLDALQLDAVHLFGVSMGGMIAQIMAANYPKRVRSLMMMMSSSGHPKLPLPTWEVFYRLVKRPKSKKKNVIIEHSLKTWKLIGSPAYPSNEFELRQRIERNYERSYSPAGYKRQLAAIIATPNRWKLLSKINTPTLVIHGTEDPMSPIEHGRELASRIEKSVFVEIQGMGHNLPTQLLPRYAGLIHQHIETSTYH